MRFPLYLYTPGLNNLVLYSTYHIQSQPATTKSCFNYCMVNIKLTFPEFIIDGVYSVLFHPCISHILLETCAEFLFEVLTQCQVLFPCQSADIHDY